MLVEEEKEDDAKEEKKIRVIMWIREEDPLEKEDENSKTISYRLIGRCVGLGQNNCVCAWFMRMFLAFYHSCSWF